MTAQYLLFEPGAWHHRAPRANGHSKGQAPALPVETRSKHESACCVAKGR